MRLFYDTMRTPEFMEFYIEVQGRKITRAVQISTSDRSTENILQMLRARAHVEGDRLSDVTGFRLYDKTRKMCVQKTLSLPYKFEEARDMLGRAIDEARRTVQEQEGSVSDV